MDFTGLLREDWSNNLNSSLEEITFSQVNITDAHLKCIVEGCPNLSKMVFTECTGITDVLLKYISDNCKPPSNKVDIEINYCENTKLLTWGTVREVKVGQHWLQKTVIVGILIAMIWTMYFP